MNPSLKSPYTMKVVILTIAADSAAVSSTCMYSISYIVHVCVVSQATHVHVYMYIHVHVVGGQMGIQYTCTCIFTCTCTPGRIGVYITKTNASTIQCTMYMYMYLIKISVFEDSFTQAIQFAIHSSTLPSTMYNKKVGSTAYNSTSKKKTCTCIYPTL